MTIKRKPIVLIESPYAQDTEEMVAYARCAMADCLKRGEAPFASHVLYTQPGVLDDTIHEEREIGMAAGWAFLHVVDRVAVYDDHGISEGMKRGIERATAMGVQIEYRQVETTEHSRSPFPLIDPPADSADFIERARLARCLRAEGLMRSRSYESRSTYNSIADRVERGDL